MKEGQASADAADGRQGSQAAPDERHAASPFHRDLLAADRTRMANERTLLAYVRTSLYLLVAGIGFVHLFDTRAFKLAGAGAVVAAATAFLTGVVRYHTVARDLAAFKSAIGESDRRHRQRQGDAGAS